MNDQLFKLGLDSLAGKVIIFYRSEYVLSYLILSYLPSENDHRHVIIADFNKNSFGFFYVEFIRFV